jgi:hypothetical protein
MNADERELLDPQVFQYSKNLLRITDRAEDLQKVPPLRSGQILRNAKEQRYSEKRGKRGWRKEESYLRLVTNAQDTEFSMEEVQQVFSLRDDVAGRVGLRRWGVDELASLQTTAVRNAFDIPRDGLSEKLAELADGKGDATSVPSVGVHRDAVERDGEVARGEWDVEGAVMVKKQGEKGSVSGKGKRTRKVDEQTPKIPERGDGNWHGSSHAHIAEVLQAEVVSMRRRGRRKGRKRTLMWIGLMARRWQWVMSSGVLTSSMLRQQRRAVGWSLSYRRRTLLIPTPPKKGIKPNISSRLWACCVMQKNRTVEFASLRGNVGGGEVEATEKLLVSRVVHLLGDDATVPWLVELVNHDTVELGELEGRKG